MLHEDYIRTAHAKGLTRQSVIIRHALRNALIPVVTILGPLSAAVLTGSLIVEQIFAIPGMGRYFVSSINNRDYPMVMAVGYLLVNHRVLQPDRRYSLCLHRPPSQTVNLKPWNRTATDGVCFGADLNWQRASRERSGRMRCLRRDPLVVACVAYLVVMAVVAIAPQVLRRRLRPGELRISLRRQAAQPAKS